MKINSEHCLFTRDASPCVPELEMKENHFKSLEKIKVLGMIPGKKLTFWNHLDIVEKKAGKAHGSFIFVGKTEKFSISNMVKIIQHHFPPAWQTANYSQLEKNPL